MVRIAIAGWRARSIAHPELPLQIIVIARFDKDHNIAEEPARIGTIIAKGIYSLDDPAQGGFQVKAFTTIRADDSAWRVPFEYTW